MLTRLRLTVFAVLLTVFASGFSPAHAADRLGEKSIVCAVYIAKKKQASVKARGSYDKFRHCSLSCIITRLCNPLDAFNIGVLKEAYDVIGPGNAELGDLRADLCGIDIGVSRKTRSDEDCFKACNEIYPRKTSSKS